MEQVEYTTPNGQTSMREYHIERRGAWVNITIMKQSGRHADRDYSYNIREKRWAYGIEPSDTIKALVPELNVAAR